jgi:hypothetical protein
MADGRQFPLSGGAVERRAACWAPARAHGWGGALCVRGAVGPALGGRTDVSLDITRGGLETKAG